VFYSGRNTFSWSLPQPEIVEYPDSHKYFATATLADGTRFEGLHQSDNNFDYWENEP
jgi:hypothetical protein